MSTMSTRRRKGLTYGITCYLIFLGLVAVYHYSDSHRAYATDKTISKAKMPANPTLSVVRLTSNASGKPVPVVAPVPKPMPANSTPSIVRVTSHPSDAPVPKPVPPKPTASAPKPVAQPEPRAIVPNAPSNLTPGAKAKQGGQVNYKILGPGSVGVGEYYDTTLGSITKVTASSYLGNDHNAGAIEVNGGPRIARLNLTYGLSFTDHQRVKLSAEYLEERLNYDFASGTSGHWDGQSAIGGGYDYLVNNHYLQSAGIAGYFAHANSRDLSDASFTQNGQQFTENRRIAGANTGNVHFDIAGHLWPYSRVSGGADYDTVHFNTRYNNNDQNVHGFGGHAKVEQRLWPSVKVVAEGHWQQVDNDYLVGVNWLMPSPSGVQFELEGTTDYYDSLATNRHFYTNGVRLNANFGVPEDQQKTVYSDLSQAGSSENLLDWTRTPAVRMTEVLAVADSRVNGSLVQAVISCPDPGTISCTGSSCTLPSGWTAVQTGVNEGDNAISFSQAFFNTSSPDRGCTYERGGLNNNEVIITNSNLGNIAGDNWVTSNPTMFVCNTSASGCQFVDNRFS